MHAIDAGGRGPPAPRAASTSGSIRPAIYHPLKEEKVNIDSACTLQNLRL